MVQIILCMLSSMVIGAPLVGMESGDSNVKPLMQHEFILQVMSNETDVVQKMLVEHPSFNVNYGHASMDYMTALHVAVLNGSVGMVQALLAHPGIDVNVKDSYHRTPLMYLSHSKEEDRGIIRTVYELLLERNAVEPSENDAKMIWRYKPPAPSFAHYYATLSCMWAQARWDAKDTAPDKSLWEWCTMQ